jgi:hypothetical protein
MTRILDRRKTRRAALNAGHNGGSDNEANSRNTQRATENFQGELSPRGSEKHARDHDSAKDRR